MNAILLTLVVLAVTIQQVAKKAYNNKISGGVFSFAAASALCALLIFLLTSGGKLHFTTEFLWYSVGFSFFYCVSTVGSMLAIRTGSLSLTSLIVQYSLVVPTFYGLVALKEPVKFWLFLGIGLLLISLVLINLEGRHETKQITLRWGIYAFLAFVGNGGCSTVQKVQQIQCGGQYKNEIMILSLALTVVTLFIFAFAVEKKQVAGNLKGGLGWFAVCGFANGAANYMVLILSNSMPASVMFPVISAGGIITTALVSVFVYKEKMSLPQKIGLLLGTVAIVALNL